MKKISKEDFARKYKEISIKALAEELNVSKHTINYWARKFKLPKKRNKIAWIN